MKRWYALLVGLFISAVALYLAFRQADFGEIWLALQTARYSFVVLSLVLFVMTIVLRGLRWSVLTQGRLSTWECFWLFNIGFLFNDILPARLGEIARAFLAGRKQGMYFSSALSSIVVERLFDMVSVVVLFGIVLIGLDLPGWATGAGTGMGIIAVVGILILAFAARYPEGALRLGARLLSLIPGITVERASAFLQPFVEGLGGVSSLRTFAAGMGLSIFAWLVSGFNAWVLMLAFWRSSEVPLVMGQLAVAAAGLGIAVPAAPSGVGPFHAAVIGVLTAVGYNADVSRSYAFVLHAMNVVVTALFGGLGLMREGVSFGEVARVAQSLREQPPSSGADSQPEVPSS
jgi:uncharacterized protein (TIRG00374 family)